MVLKLDLDLLLNLYLQLIVVGMMLFMALHEPHQDR